MSDKKRFNKPGSLQPNIEDILQWNDLPADAFDPATSEEKEEGIAKLINKEDFPDLLEIINDDDKFKNDNNNINNGCPVLFWQ